MTQDDPTDLELVRRCRENFPYATGAFELLMRRHEGAVYRYCLHYLRHEQDAADAAQEAFTNAFFHIGKFESRSSFKTWVLRIAQNTCARQYRRGRRGRPPPPHQTRHPGAAGEPEPSEIPDYARVPTEGEVRVALVMDAMAEQERQVLLLRHVSELSLQEIAEVMEISLSAAKMRLYRAEALFRGAYLKLEAQPFQSLPQILVIFPWVIVTFGNQPRL